MQNPQNPQNSKEDRNICNDPTCNNIRIYYCVEDHKMSFCGDCRKHHLECRQIIDIKDLSEVKRNFHRACKLVTKLQTLSSSNSIPLYISGIDENFKNLHQTVYDIDKQIDQAIDTDDFPAYDILQQQVDSLMLQMKQDQILQAILFYATEASLKFEEFDDETDLSKADKVQKYIERATAENRRVVEQNYEFRKKHEHDFEVHKLKNTHKDQLGEVTQELQITVEQLKDLEKQCKEELKRAIPSMTVDASDPNIDTNLGFLSTSLKTPFLITLSFQKVKDAHEPLSNFLKNGNFECIKNFCFNHPYAPDTEGVSFDYYSEGMLKAIEVTQKEVYLVKMILTEQNLSSIIKAAKNVKRVILRNCRITTGAGLDFTTVEDSNIEYLSFYNCGYSQWNQTNWDAKPEEFGHILSSIKASPLKFSLKELNIQNCGISVAKVRELKGDELANLKIVERIDEPQEA